MAFQKKSTLVESTLASSAHACRGKQSEDAEHGSKGAAADHGVSSPSMLCPRCVHRQGKEIHYLQISPQIHHVFWFYCALHYEVTSGKEDGAAKHK